MSAILVRFVVLACGDVAGDVLLTGPGSRDRPTPLGNQRRVRWHRAVVGVSDPETGESAATRISRQVNPSPIHALCGMTGCSTLAKWTGYRSAAAHAR